VDVVERLPEEYDSLRRGFAELVGAFALIFVGVSASLVSSQDLLAVAFAHGLVIAVMVSALGHISGGHFNPAVTIGFLVTRRIVPILAAVYIVAQLVGATLGALAARWLFPGQVDEDAGVPRVNEILNVGNGMALEAILTFFLVWVIFATAVDPRGTFRAIAGLAIGFTITLDVLVGGPLTGAAMNPARAFGPQLVQGVWDDAWVYYVGPVLGAIVAAVAYDRLYLRPLRPAPVGPPETGVIEPRAGDVEPRAGDVEPRDRDTD
jgi:aquaporin TIP